MCHRSNSGHDCCSYSYSCCSSRFEVNCVEVKLSCFRESASASKMRLVAAGLLGLVAVAAAQYSYR